MWIVPTELTSALRGIGAALGGTADDDDGAGAHVMSNGGGRRTRAVPTAQGDGPALEGSLGDTTLEDPAAALQHARDEAAVAVADAEGESRRTGHGSAPTHPEFTEISDSTRPGR
jgi:hypothetical protein